MINILPEVIKQLAPNNKNPAEWSNKFNLYLETFEINTKDRVIAFLSQTAHESNGFTVLVENLNYSQSGLIKTFAKYFNYTTALEYQRKPDLIANRVYANRMGNGDEKSGDGWKYRGRGIIQLTGKSNYSQYSNDMYESDRIVTYPDLVAEPADAIKSACWFWTKNDLNDIADRKDVYQLTRRINGGTHGLEDRKMKYQLLEGIM